MKVALRIHAVSGLSRRAQQNNVGGDGRDENI